MADHGALESTQTPNQSGGRGRMEKLAPPVVGSLLLLFALVGLIGTAIRDPKPHDIPVGLVGPPPAVQQIATAFGSSAPGAFTFTSYGSEADGRAAVDSRAVDGVVILGEATPRIIVAGAAGDAATGVITAAFTNAFKAQGATAQVEVVHHFASGGPVGSQLLPDFYRWLAPWMPAGPLYSSLRGALYFDGAGLGAPVIVVTAWLVGGLILMLLGDLTRTGRRSGTVVQAPAA